MLVRRRYGDEWSVTFFGIRYWLLIWLQARAGIKAWLQPCRNAPESDRL
jgi:hypothetical protein